MLDLLENTMLKHTLLINHSKSNCSMKKSRQQAVGFFRQIE